MWVIFIVFKKITLKTVTMLGILTFYLEVTWPENINLQDVPRTVPSSVSRTSTKDPICHCVDVRNWRPGEVLIWSFEDALKWHPEDALIWRSRNLPWRTFKARISDYVGLSVGCPKICFNFSFQTYSVDQIYLKAIQHSRCTENPIELLRWSLFCEIS